MKNEPGKSKTQKSLDERFSKHPEMYDQMHRIADEMEQAIAGGMTADEAEQMAIQRINELGRAMLSDWARARHQRSVQEVREQKPSVIRDSKKTELAHDLWHGGDSRADTAAESAGSSYSAILCERSGPTQGILARLATCSD